MGTSKGARGRGSWGSGGRAIATPSLTETRRGGPSSLSRVFGWTEAAVFHLSLQLPCSMRLLTHQAAGRTSALMGPYCSSAKSLQSYPTLCDPLDGSPPGSPCFQTPRVRETGRASCAGQLDCRKGWVLHEWVGAAETGSGPWSWMMLHTFGCPPVIMGRDQPEGLSEGWGPWRLPCCAWY